MGIYICPLKYDSVSCILDTIKMNSYYRHFDWIKTFGPTYMQLFIYLTSKIKYIIENVIKIIDIGYMT